MCLRGRCVIGLRLTIDRHVTSQARNRPGSYSHSTRCCSDKRRISDRTDRSCRRGQSRTGREHVINKDNSLWNWCCDPEPDRTAFVARRPGPLTPPHRHPQYVKNRKVDDHRDRIREVHGLVDSKAHPAGHRPSNRNQRIGTRWHPAGHCLSEVVSCRSWPAVLEVMHKANCRTRMKKWRSNAQTSDGPVMCDNKMTLTRRTQRPPWFRTCDAQHATSVSNR